MQARLPHLILGVMLLAWLVLGAGPLVQTYNDGARLREALGDRRVDERLAALDHPGYRIARQLSESTPSDACIVVMAYAGPAAIDYYRSRFNYFLYPRRVTVFADSSTPLGDCEYVAIFRDTPQNLAASPFQGTWNSDDLDERLAGFRVGFESELVTIYRRPAARNQ